MVIEPPILTQKFVDFGNTTGRRQYNIGTPVNPLQNTADPHKIEVTVQELGQACASEVLVP